MPNIQYKKKTACLFAGKSNLKVVMKDPNLFSQRIVSRTNIDELDEETIKV